jgi:hypothetical protein
MIFIKSTQSLGNMLQKVLIMNLNAKKEAYHVQTSGS